MYKPDYDTEIRTITYTERQDTWHTKYIDWDNYPFDLPEHTSGMCCSEERKREEIAKLKEWLKEMEGGVKDDDVDVFASNYGGWPRLWNKVIYVGMCSAWPYWKPRPTVLVDGVLGTEKYDWLQLTGCETRKR